MARRYRSRRPPSKGAVAAVVAGGLLSAIALACAWPFLGELGELAFIGMGLRAFLIGALLAWICERSGFSRPRLAAAIAGAATALSIVGAHYVAYRSERVDKTHAAEQLREQRAGFGSDPIEVQSYYDSTIAQLTFAGYWRRYFGLHGPGIDGASNFMGPAFGIGLASLELVVALLVGMYLPAGRASEPVCESCRSWLCEQTLAQARFGCTARFTELLLDEKGDEAVSLLAPADTREFLHLALALCPKGHQSRAGVLRLREHLFARRGRQLLVRHRADLQLSEQEQQLLDAAIASIS